MKHATNINIVRLEIILRLTLEKLLNILNCINIVFKKLKKLLNICIIITDIME
jgi:hypothetical protein